LRSALNAAASNSLAHRKAHAVIIHEWLHTRNCFVCMHSIQAPSEGRALTSPWCALDIGAWPAAGVARPLRHNTDPPLTC
jgi:hypothetical protein